MKLENGKPANVEGRLKKELRVYDFLDKLGIDFQRVDHNPIDTMEECKAIDMILGATICKNLFLCNAQKTKFYLFMVNPDKMFKTKDISKQIDSPRLSFAGPEFMEKYLDIMPGAVSVMGLMNDKNNDVQLVIDKDLTNGEFIACHPCVNTCSIRLKTDDLFKLFLPAVKHDAIFVEV